MNGMKWLFGCRVTVFVVIIWAAKIAGGQDSATAQGEWVDYVAAYNELTRPEGLTEENNAWVLYKQAIDAYVPMSEELQTHDEEMTEERMADPNDPYWGLVAEWAEQNDAALKLFHQAAQRPLFWREYVVEEPGEGLNDTFDTKILLDMRNLVRLADLRHYVFVFKKDYDKAAEDLLAVIRCGKHLCQHKPLLISYLVGISIIRLGDDSFEALLAQHNFTTWQLADFRKTLEAMPKLGHMSFDAEHLFALDLVQYVFGPGVRTKPNPIRWMNLHFPRRNELFSVWDEIEYSRDLFKFSYYALIHVDRQATLDRVNADFDEKKPAETHSPFEIQRDYPQIRKAKPFSSAYAVLYYPYWPLLSEEDLLVRGAGMIHCTYRRHNAFVCIVALKHYRRERGLYPPDLETLKRKGYLQQLPLDPYSDGALTYRRVGDDFLLYSYGGDMDDDGGRPCEGHPWGWNGKDGDRVFWPVQRD